MDEICSDEESEAQSVVELLDSRPIELIDDLQSDKSIQVSVKSYRGSYSLLKRKSINVKDKTEIETGLNFDRNVIDLTEDLVKFEKNLVRKKSYHEKLLEEALHQPQDRPPLDAYSWVQIF